METRNSARVRPPEFHAPRPFVGGLGRGAVLVPHLYHRHGTAAGRAPALGEGETGGRGDGRTGRRGDGETGGRKRRSQHEARLAWRLCRIAPSPPLPVPSSLRRPGSRGRCRGAGAGPVPAAGCTALSGEGWTVCGRTSGL